LLSKCTPLEIAFDIASAQRAIEAVNGHKRSASTIPLALGYQGVDYVKFIRTFKDRIILPHEGCLWGHGDGTVGVIGGPPPSPTRAANGTSAPSATATSTSKKSTSPSTTSAIRSFERGWKTRE